MKEVSVFVLFFSFGKTTAKGVTQLKQQLLWFAGKQRDVLPGAFCTLNAEGGWRGIVPNQTKMILIHPRYHQQFLPRTSADIHRTPGTQARIQELLKTESQFPALHSAMNDPTALLVESLLGPTLSRKNSPPFPTLRTRRHTNIRLLTLWQDSISILQSPYLV